MPLTTKSEPTLYAVLQSPPGATREELHEAYLKLAFDLRHVVESTTPTPEKDAQRFREITGAWGVLKDSKARRQYDAKLKLAGNQCTNCEGTGRKWTFATRREELCKVCKGTGQKQ
jgi:DnaJ-class molecular chaperone